MICQEIVLRKILQLWGTEYHRVLSRVHTFWKLKQPGFFNWIKQQPEKLPTPQALTFDGKSVLRSCFPTTASKHPWMSPFRQEYQIQSYDSKSLYSEENSEIWHEKKIKRRKKNIKRKALVFLLKAFSHAKVPRENFPAQSPGYKHVEGQWHSTKPRRLSSDLFELTTPIWHKGTHFTDEEQGNHSQSQSYKQVPPNPWIL